MKNATIEFQKKSKQNQNLEDERPQKGAQHISQWGDHQQNFFKNSKILAGLPQNITKSGVTLGKLQLEGRKGMGRCVRGIYLLVNNRHIRHKIIVKQMHKKDTNQSIFFIYFALHLLFFCHCGRKIFVREGTEWGGNAFRNLRGEKGVFF